MAANIGLCPLRKRESQFVPGSAVRTKLPEPVVGLFQIETASPTLGACLSLEVNERMKANGPLAA